MMIPISKNDLHFVGANDVSKFMEACNGSDFVERTVSGRGIIKIDPFCSLKIADYLIKSHKTPKQADDVQIILPSVELGELSLNFFSKELLASVQMSTQHELPPGFSKP